MILAYARFWPNRDRQILAEACLKYNQRPATPSRGYAETRNMQTLGIPQPLLVGRSWLTKRPTRSNILRFVLERVFTRSALYRRRKTNK